MIFCCITYVFVTLPRSFYSYYHVLSIVQCDLSIVTTTLPSYYLQLLPFNTGATWYLNKDGAAMTFPQLCLCLSSLLREIINSLSKTKKKFFL